MNRKFIIALPLIPLAALASSNYKAIITEFDYIFSSKKIEKNVTDWKNVGSEYDCSSWNPDENTIDYGLVFEQTKDCSQDQERTRDIYSVMSDGTEKYLETLTDSQTINKNHTQDSIGTKNSILNERAEPWSAWIDVNGHYDCDIWSPDVSTIDHGTVFTQNRNCSQDQQRERDVFNVWADGSETLNRNETEDQTITEQESQSATGTKNIILSERADPWSAWVDVNGYYDCTIWTPDPATINYGTKFTQNRDCSQDQQRDRDVYDVWADGTETFNRNETEDQTITERDSQEETGTKNFTTGTSYGDWSNWVDVGNHHTCGSYSPDPATINYGQSFTQTRTCKQDQERVRDVFDDMADGTKVKVGTEKDTQTINENETRAATGTKNYKVGTSYGSWGNWYDVGGHHTCGSYSPDPATINYGQSFTQTRVCKQNQERVRDVFDDMADGTKVKSGTDKDTQTINENETRAATGTKNYVTGTSYGAWGSWYDVGGHYSCGGYSPDPSTVNYGTKFTQTRVCKQNQDRVRDVFNDMADGTKVKTGTQKGSQTINENETRQATGTKNYKVGTSYGSWGGWYDVGGHHTCGSWSPATSTVNYGTKFTQTRTCKQNQERVRDVFDDMADGSKVKTGTQKGTQTINENVSQQATGTKNYVTGTSYGSWSSWKDSGGHYSCGSWSPSPSTVDAGKKFTQTRSCKQNQTRTRTVYNNWADGSQTVKTTESQSQTINENETQQATGTKPISGVWTYVGYTYVQGCIETDPPKGSCTIGATYKEFRDDGSAPYGGCTQRNWECK